MNRHAMLCARLEDLGRGRLDVVRADETIW
jgi:hypothetical protein